MKFNSMLQFQNMKCQYALVSILFFASIFIWQGKDYRLRNHVDMITALAEIRANSESIKSDAKGWKGDGANKAITDIKELYRLLKVADEKLIDKYETIIPDSRKADRQGIIVDNELSELQKANNNLVKFYKDNYEKYNNNPRLVITAEIVKLVFDSGIRVYDFFAGIKAKTVELWTK